MAKERLKDLRRWWYDSVRREAEMEETMDVMSSTDRAERSHSLATKGGNEAERLIEYPEMRTVE